MGIIVEVYAILLYNLILLEFLIMAALSWYHDGLATRGTGRYFGPFALMAAAILLSVDANRLGVEIPLWFLFVIWTALGMTGLRVVIHMTLQVYRAKKVIEELEVPE